MTTPEAFTQPAQWDGQGTQLNRIASLRSSSEALACAEPPEAKRPGRAIDKAAAQSSAEPLDLSDLTSLKMDPFPAPQVEQW